MKIHTSGIGLRIGATILGIGYGVIGAFSIWQSTNAPNPELAGRALWMGITFLIASALAVAVSREWPGLVLPGIIVGLLGYAVGNYLGIEVANLVRAFGIGL